LGRGRGMGSNITHTNRFGTLAIREKLRDTQHPVAKKLRLRP
jgi:hypothetical protein